MKILYLPKWYPRPSQPVSGIFVQELCKAASRYDEVAVVHAYRDRSIRRAVQVTDSEEDGVRVIRAAFRSVPQIMFPVATVLAYNLLKRDFRPDLTHVHVHSASFLALLLKVFRRIPYVLTEHYAVNPTLFDVSNPGDGLIKRLTRVRLAKMAFRGARMQVNVSEYMQEQIRKLGISSESRIVPNVVDHTSFFPDSEVAAGCEEKKILFVGSLVRRKGLDTLLKAVSQIAQGRNDFSVQIVGDGPSRAAFEQLAATLGLSEVAVFHGNLSKAEVAVAMRNASFLVLPSLWENLPCVIVEAMSSGLPVIASDVGGINEMISGNTGILVKPGDVGELVEALEHMLNHRQAFDSTGIRAEAVRRFSYDVVGKELSDIYVSCASS